MQDNKDSSPFIPVAFMRRWTIIDPSSLLLLTVCPGYITLIFRLQFQGLRSSNLPHKVSVWITVVFQFLFTHAFAVSLFSPWNLCFRAHFWYPARLRLTFKVFSLHNNLLAPCLLTADHVLGSVWHGSAHVLDTLSAASQNWKIFCERWSLYLHLKASSLKARLKKTSNRSTDARWKASSRN